MRGDGGKGIDLLHYYVIPIYHLALNSLAELEQSEGG
jgi:hypothetical protein